MAKIQRQTQKIFAGNAPADDIAVFGSFKTGTPVYTDNIEVLQSAAYESGWSSAIVANEAPFMEELNGIQYGFSQQIAYNLQEGIAEYDPNTTYYKGSIVKALNSEEIPVLYYSLIDENVGNALDSENWAVLSVGGGGGTGSAGLNLFDTVLKDHILSFEESKGLALQGTYVYKDAVAGSRYGYPDFYNKCVEEFSNDSNTLDVLDTNIVKVGSPTVNNGVISGFTSTDYAITPAVPTSVSSYEMVVKFTTGSLTKTQMGILANSTVNKSTPQFYTNNNTELYFLHPITAETWSSSFKAPIEPYTTYWARAIWNGSNLEVSYKTTKNGEWISLTTTGSTAAPSCNWSEELGIGIDTPTIPFDGSIDLTETYVNINGERWWTGAISVSKNPNGHLFYNIANKSAIDEIYNNTGTAWCYGVDTANERIFLPRNDNFVQCTGNTADVGKFLKAGLPNITAEVGLKYRGQFDYATGAASLSDLVQDLSGGGSSSAYQKLTIDASNSNSIYGNSDTVQPAAVKKLVYMVVGSTEVTSSIIDVTEITTSENDTIPLFTAQYFDFAPNNPSWLKAGEQKNSGGIYTTAYNTLVNCLTENIYNIKVVDTIDMTAGVDYSEYWKVDQTNMTFTTPLVTSLLSTIRNARILIDKKEPTETDTSWYNLYSDGWCEQGGFPYLAQNNTKITLPKSYIDSNYTLTFGSFDTDTNSNISAAAYVTGTKTQNSFNVVSGYNGTFFAGNFGWQTAGYAAKPTVEEIVQSENVNLYFKVANAVENLELLDAGEVLETLANKTDIVQATAASLPSGQYINYTLGASGMVFTAPEDGWIVLAKTTTAANQYVQFNGINETLGYRNQMLVGDNCPTSGNIAYIAMPMLKGQSTSIFYNAGGDVISSIFIYAKGVV